MTILDPQLDKNAIVALDGKLYFIDPDNYFWPDTWEQHKEWSKRMRKETKKASKRFALHNLKYFRRLTEQ